MATETPKSFEEKQHEVVAIFTGLDSQEAVYQKIIDLGKTQKSLSAEEKTAECLVPGCQSKMYLLTRYVDGRLFFETEADALISAGLGILLTLVYSGETPESILKNPPRYLDQIGIKESLTPGRANGLASLLLKMKQQALRYLMTTPSP